MRAKSNLYILRQLNTNEIYAISEFQEWIAHYIQLFEGYFNQNEMDKSMYQVDILTETKTINEYLKRYQDYQLFPRGIQNKLVLTEWEWNYYKPFFRELYERMKDTIVNLKMFHEIYKYHTNSVNFSENNSESITQILEPYNVLHKASNDLYDIACDFDTFIEYIPIPFIQKKVLMEPIKAHKFNQFLEEFQRQYGQKWD